MDGRTAGERDGWALEGGVGRREEGRKRGRDGGGTVERGRVSEGGPSADGTEGRVDEGRRREGEREGGRDGGSEVAQYIWTQLNYCYYSPNKFQNDSNVGAYPFPIQIVSQKISMLANNSTIKKQAQPPKLQHSRPT